METKNNIINIIKEYLKHLMMMEMFERQRYLIEFEKFPVGEIFRKRKNELLTDYEFVEDTGKIKINYYANSNRNYLNSISVYLKKLNNNQCEEVLTHTLFERTKDNRFYSNETGLIFDFYNGFEKAVGMNLDWVYVDNINTYLEYYKKLQKEDNEKISKGQYLLLKRRINFSKGGLNEKI